MDFESVKKFVEFMGKDMKLWRNGRRISVFQDGWHYENMRVILRKYRTGLLAWLAVCVAAAKFLRDSSEANLHVSIAIVLLVLYVFIIMMAFRQTQRDVGRFEQETEYGGEIGRVYKRIRLSVTGIAVVNYVCIMILYAVYLYFPAMRINGCSLAVAALAVVNALYLYWLYRPREAVFMFYMPEDGSEEVAVKLRNERTIVLKDSFDINMNGEDMIILRDSKGLFDVYGHEQIVSICFMNSRQQTEYRATDMGWFRQVS